mmetsp:Transcript_27682/g.88128  ORF Transcript_27682/g.88128 Transcript_27682/m.88128 type:complete len:257 (-) Transcript_27682:380-1150(-)
MACSHPRRLSAASSNRPSLYPTSPSSHPAHHPPAPPTKPPADITTAACNGSSLRLLRAATPRSASPAPSAHRASANNRSVASESRSRARPWRRRAGGRRDGAGVSTAAEKGKEGPNEPPPPPPPPPASPPPPPACAKRASADSCSSANRIPACRTTAAHSPTLPASRAILERTRDSHSVQTRWLSRKKRQTEGGIGSPPRGASAAAAMPRSKLSRKCNSSRAASRAEGGWVWAGGRGASASLSLRSRASKVWLGPP